MTDILTRLRDKSGSHINGCYDNQAADEIERLRNELVKAERKLAEAIEERDGALTDRFDAIRDAEQRGADAARREAISAVQALRNPHEDASSAHAWDMGNADAMKAIRARIGQPTREGK